MRVRKLCPFSVFALLVMAVAVVVGPACSEGPKTLDGSVVPAHVVADEAMIMENKTVKDKTWYAYAEGEGYDWYAIRFVINRDGQESEEWCIRALSTSANEKNSWKLGVGFAVKDEVFYGSRTEQTLGSMINIMAAGVVTDPQVVTIKGTTVHGKTASVAPVNSSWCLTLVDIGMVDQWSRIEALDADGNVLHSIAFTNSSRQ